MKKQTVADKMAEKTFRSKMIQNSWQSHMAAFGPILEPAFDGDFQSRVHLTAALNLISNRKGKEGMEKLDLLEGKCVCDADWAALHFFRGVAAELMSKKPNEIVSCYEKAAEFGHKFYLPYIKLARYAHFDANFEAAEKWYRKGIFCLESKYMSEREAAALASAYANLCSCLTMMHRYEDASMALDRSKTAADKLPSRLATEAILYAAMGEKEKVAAVICVIEKQVPGLLSPTVEMTEQILKGEHAHFSVFPIAEEAVSAFWQWFRDAELTDEILSMELAKVFSFMQRPLQVTIEENKILLKDYYVKALTQGYQTLISACPEEIQESWIFQIVH